MKCSKCGRDYPRKILKIHEPLCEGVKHDPRDFSDMSEYELRAEAKKQGIRSWHNKKLENIITELEGE